MDAMTTGMKDLKAAASSGSFAISESGAKAYVQAIDQALDDLSGMEKDLFSLQQETKLGTSPDAQTISRYNLEGAVGGAGTAGIVPAVNQLKTALTDAKAAMEKAVQNYRAVDDGNAATYNRS